MAGINDLYDVAAAFLTAATEALDLTDAGAPGRRFVGDGEPALDCCGQLVVWNQQLDDFVLEHGTGRLASLHAIQRGGVINTLIHIQATRCILYKPLDPTGGSKANLPDPDLISATAKMIDQDGWALRLGLADSLRHGLLEQVCKGAEIMGGTKMTPQGQCVGWTFVFRYPMEGGILSP